MEVRTATNRVLQLVVFVLEPVVPGMALPKAMERIEKNLESVARMGRMKGSSEAQLAGLLAVCEEQQRLLKLAFIGKTMYLGYSSVY